MARSIILLLSLIASSGCHEKAGPVHLRLATTTSPRDSGLLDFLQPRIAKDLGIVLDVIAVGSGQALKLGERGDADLLLTHDPPGEKAFAAAGHGIEQRPVMWNEFIIVGPKEDPAHIAGMTDAVEAYRALARAGGPYLSRGDESGTHRKEQSLLAEAGLTLPAPWLKATGQGMGATLNMAFERKAYTLTDRATWLAHKQCAELPLFVEKDRRLQNPYALTLVNPARHEHVNAEAARKVIAWFTGEPGKRALTEFRVQGQQVFFTPDQP